MYNRNIKKKTRNIGPCRKAFELEIPSGLVKERLEEAYRSAQKNASIPGYRPGKVPRDLLEKHYGERVVKNVIENLMPEAYEQTIKEAGLIPLNIPEISNINLSKDKTLFFKVEVDVRPRIELKVYKGLKVSKKSIQVKDEDVDKYLKTLQGSHAKFKDSKSGSVELGNYDEFAKDLGFKAVSELKESVKKFLESQVRKQIEEDVENQILEQLLKNSKFDVPGSFIDRQTQYLAEESKQRLLRQGLKDEEIKKKDEELKSKARPQAVNQVKVMFILDEIAKCEGVTVADEEVENALDEIARRTNQSRNKVAKYYREKDLMSNLRANIRERKVIEWLVKEAEIREDKGYKGKKGV